MHSSLEVLGVYSRSSDSCRTRSDTATGRPVDPAYSVRAAGPLRDVLRQQLRSPRWAAAAARVGAEHGFPDSAPALGFMPYVVNPADSARCVACDCCHSSEDSALPGTFTLSNVGSIGGTYTMPVVLSPEVRPAPNVHPAPPQPGCECRVQYTCDRSQAQPTVRTYSGL